MKGLIIGSDLLEHGGDVKFLEINTNTTIYNDGADLLDYDVLFNTLNTNNINEFHFIWNEMDAYYPIGENYKFKDNLIQKCQENNITFTEYVVPKGSMTVPFIEDADNKFILRQSFDTTALIDDTYCADKFEFFKLMSGSTYIPKTYQLDNELGMDTFDTIDTLNPNHPNTLIKARLPHYDSELFPELHVLTQESQLNDLKSSLPENHLLQEFIYSDENLVEGRYSIIRSIDIVYGPELDVINMGGYRQSTIIPVNLSQNELVENTTKLNQKSRYKYITKSMTNRINDYHTDGESLILNYDGTLKDVNSLELGDFIKSINFVDFNGNEAANFEEGKIDVLQWDSTLEQSNSTLTQMSSTLEGITSSSIDTMFIRITLSDGRTWTDTPGTTYYIEESGSLDTRFEKLNKMYVGDKLVTTDKDTNTLTTIEITGLEMEYGVKTIYSLDFEPSDLFLVMHNSCWCCWSVPYCGTYCCVQSCSICGYQNPEKL
jgi:hypothetical protein